MRIKKDEFLAKMQLCGDSQSSLANRCHIKRQTIGAWVSGERNPKPNNIKRVADALQCKIEDIAYIDTEIERVAAHGDKFAQEILGITDGSVKTDDTFIADVFCFVATALSAQIQLSNQSEVGRKIGLSASQINRIAHGKADMSLFPLGALLRLCPQLINRDVLSGTIQKTAVENIDTWLLSAIGNMSQPEKQMLKNIIQAAMPRFASHGDSKTQNPEPETQIEPGSSEVSRP